MRVLRITGYRIQVAGKQVLEYKLFTQLSSFNNKT